MSNGTERNAQESDPEFKPLKAAKECCTKSFKKVNIFTCIFVVEYLKYYEDGTSILTGKRY